MRGFHSIGRMGLIAALLVGCGGYSRHQAATKAVAAEAVAAAEAPADFDTESYDKIDENGFASVSQQPLSTFSIDVDTASYSNVRRYLTGGSLPPADAVRIEELVNYFPYDYEAPSSKEPFALPDETGQICPGRPACAARLVATLPASRSGRRAAGS